MGYFNQTKNDNNYFLKKIIAPKKMLSQVGL